MFTTFEYYLLASWVYPLISITTHIVKNKTRIMNEIFSVKGFDSYEELYMNSVRQRAPTYVSGPNMFIPIGGGTYNEWHRVYSALRGSPNGLYWNYSFHKLSKSIIHNATIYINSHVNLEKYIPKEEQTRFPIAYPMKLEKYNVKSPLLYFHQPTGYVETSKNTLLAQVLFKTRPAGTLAIPSIALLCFLASWGVYKHNKYLFPTLHLYDPPPTNIFNTIKKNLYK
jgi:hypothetical protein